MSAEGLVGVKHSGDKCVNKAEMLMSECNTGAVAFSFLAGDRSLVSAICERAQKPGFSKKPGFLIL